MRLIQITAYLRDKEDLRRWKSLPNKTEFLHNALSEVVIPTPVAGPKASEEDYEGRATSMMKIEGSHKNYLKTGKKKS